MKILSLWFLVVASCVFWGCAAPIPEREYTSPRSQEEIDRDKNEVEARIARERERWLKKKEIKARVTQELENKDKPLTWGEIIQNGTRADLRKYLAKHPDTEHKSEILVMLKVLDWAVLKEFGDSDDFREYLATHPKTEHKTEILAQLEVLRDEEFINACKEGRIEMVQRLIGEITVQDVKSEGLMMAVYGALHNSQNKFSFKSGGLVLSPPERTFSVSRDIYVTLIEFLKKSGADPNKYRYKNFDSDRVKKFLYNKKLREFSENEQGGTMTTLMTIGDGPAEQVNLTTDQKQGLSIFDVSKIEQAEDIIRLLSE